MTRLPWGVWARYVVRRSGYVLGALAVSVPRAVVFLAREAWAGKTCVSCIALSVDEENAIRTLRQQVARYAGVPRISTEELLVLLPLYIREAGETVTRSKIARVLVGRRRYRPDRGGDR
jgi:hypothetical protein